jgi:pimeloyl-ACP methyl ester carboxylesterase
VTTVVLIVLAAAVAALLLFRYLNPRLLVRWLFLGTRRLLGFRTRVVDVDGVTWSYLEGGPASAETVVLLHGFGGDKDNWPLYAWRLARGYHVVIPDLPGFGESSKDSNVAYDGATQAARLLRFIDALELERVHLGGNSMGGLIALRFALANPQRLLSLALLNSAGVLGSERSELELAAGRGENLLTVSTRAEYDELLSFVMREPTPLPGVVKQVMADNAIAHQEFWDSIFWPLRKEMQNRPMNDQLQDIIVPTLVIWGRHDRVIDVSCSDVLAAGLPDNERVVFEDIGHLPMLETPGKSSAAHLAHLRRNAVATL